MMASTLAYGKTAPEASREQVLFRKRQSLLVAQGLRFLSGAWDPGARFHWDREFAATPLLRGWSNRIQLWYNARISPYIGDPGDAFYIILQGSVSVLVPSQPVKNDEGGSEDYKSPRKSLESTNFIEVTQMKAGKSFGEKALLKYNQPRYVNSDYSLVARLSGVAKSATLQQCRSASSSELWRRSSRRHKIV